MQGRLTLFTVLLGAFLGFSHIFTGASPTSCWGWVRCCSGWAENLPLCSGLMPALTFTRLVAVPTFANPSQQPLALDGPLKDAISARALGAPRKERAKQTDVADVATRQERIAQTLSFGFGSVVACDNAGPVPDTDRITRVATGPFWAVYRLKSPG